MSMAFFWRRRETRAEGDSAPEEAAVARILEWAPALGTPLSWEMLATGREDTGKAATQRRDRDAASMPSDG